MNLARTIVRSRVACALTLIVAFSLIAPAVQAVPVTIDGSINFGADGAIQNDTAIDVSTEFIPYATTGWAGGPVYTTYALTMHDSIVDADDASGDFAGLPFTVATTTLVDLADLAAFGFTSTEGDWITKSGSIITSTDEFLDILLLGEFYPSGSLASLDPAQGELRLQLNQSGTSLGLTGTMVMTGPIIPEPATMSMLGLGALALLRRRSRKA
jgi:hypothetical protein